MTGTTTTTTSVRADLHPVPGYRSLSLWAALQAVSGGTWADSVYDVDRIVELLEAGKKALRE